VLPAVGGYTMKHSRYIFQPAKAWVTGRTREANGCHGKKRESGPKGADKPPPQKKCIILNRNAKFTPIFSRGEFGVFQYAHFSSVRKDITGTGCRDPPINRFDSLKKRLIGGKYGERIRTEKGFYFSKWRVYRINQ
jgi:hypothetical protein